MAMAFAAGERGIKRRRRSQGPRPWWNVGCAVGGDSRVLLPRQKTAMRQWLIWGRHGGGAVDLVVGIGAATGVERRAAVLLHFIDLPLQVNGKSYK